MASPEAILAAYKAVPGAATPTMPPQGGLNAPSIGQISPLAAQLANERGYANTYGPFLPRESRTFTQGAFGPFSPILPVGVDEPALGAEMPDARLWEYTTGWNLPVGQPGSEGIKLANFGTLKTLADLYSVARACIELRKNEICGLDWDIIPTKDAAKAYYGSPKQMKDFGARRGEVIKFFRKPDPDFFSFADFMSALLEEVFVFDALSILIRPKRGYKAGLGRGVLGSELDCLELISGPTMRPLVGMHGEIPRPPNPAYQQYLYGVPRSDYMTMITDRDVEDGGLLEAMVNAWSADQFMYRRLVPRRWTPYGFPPVERALVPVISGLQKQAYQLDFFKEGTVPAVYISPGDVNMTPNQIRELQEALNAIAGDVAWHHKVIVLPPGSRVDPQKPVDVADQFDDIVMTQVCQAFDVNPMELGILPKVSATATPSAVKQMAQGAASVHERLSTKPLLKFLADIFDSVLHNCLHQDDMKFTFEGLAEDAEEGALTDLLIKQVQSGIRSVDEARDELELQPWGLPLTSGPVIFTAAGAMPFGMMAAGAAGKGPNGPGGDQEGTPQPSAVPLQQTGRQGGEAGPTPGHAAATAANASIRSGRAPGIAAPTSGSVSAQKIIPAAARAELDALARHLNKGRHITTWVPRHIPSHVMAIFADDLTKGLTPDECAEDAKKTISLPAEDYEWLPKGDARRGDPWEMISGRYLPEIEAAFARAEKRWAELLDEWWTGQVVMTRPALLDSLEAIIYGVLFPLLSGLWAEAWRENDSTAGGYFEAWRDSHGRDAVEQIARSRRKQVEAALAEAVSSGRGPAFVTDQLGALLDAANRAEMIAITETGRAATAAQISNFRAKGTTHKQWVTAHDSKVCPECRKMEAEGPLPLDTLFSNGMMGPPAHPRCRCDLVPAGVVTKREQITKKQANYRPAETNEHCGNCSMITDVPPDFESHHCTLVKGLIDPEYVCDHWDAAKVSKEESWATAAKGEDGIHGPEKEVTCERGHTHHGDGGAGLLIRHNGDDGKTRYLMQKRSVTEDDPGTWSIPGGGALPGESAYQAAFREAQEEMGQLPQGVTPHHHVVDDHGGWVWTTVVCDTPEMFQPDIAGSATPDESSGYGWFTPKEISDLPLHPGFEDAWQAVLRTRKNTELGKCAVRRVNLDGQEFWTHPDPCPCEMAQGGGAYVKRPHTVDDIQYVPSGEGPCACGQCSADSDGRVSTPPPSGGTGPDTGTRSGVNRYQPNPQPGDNPGEDDDTKWSGHGDGYVPPNNMGIIDGYQGGYWPTGGIGARPPKPSSIGGQTSTGSGWPKKPSNKGLLDDVLAPNGPKVMRQLKENFPPAVLWWVEHADWGSGGPQLLDLSLVDYHDWKTWSAAKEPGRVKHFERLIEQGEDFNPVVTVKVPEKDTYRVVDGHHRALAYRNLGRPVRAWVGVITDNLVNAAEETHSSQLAQGASEGNE